MLTYGKDFCPKVRVAIVIHLEKAIGQSSIIVTNNEYIHKAIKSLDREVWYSTTRAELRMSLYNAS
jgi:hypothetical protein